MAVTLSQWQGCLNLFPKSRILPHWPLRRHFGLYSVSMVHKTKPAPEADHTTSQSTKRAHDPYCISMAGAANLVANDNDTTALVAKMYLWPRKQLNGEYIQISLPDGRYHYITWPISCGSYSISTASIHKSISRNDGTMPLTTEMPSRLPRYHSGGEKRSLSMSADATIRSTGSPTQSHQYLNGKPTTGSIHDCQYYLAEHWNSPETIAMSRWQV
jgi:hypothetical protein